MLDETSKFDPISLRPTTMDVDLDALAHNLGVIRSLAPRSKIMPVVKANAYGHGIVECARVLEEAGADLLGVALLEEGIALRLAGITMPILVLGGVFTSQIHLFLEYNLQMQASSIAKIRAIDDAAKAFGKQAEVHLEIDTGMERVGVHYYNAKGLFEAAALAKSCRVVGVGSHLVSQDAEDTALARTQLGRLLEATEYYTTLGLPMPMRHLGASGAILQLPEAHLEMVRPGLMLYGIAPSPHLVALADLRPVMSLRSKVVYFKVVRRGAGVSYDHLWTAPEDTRVVTVPIGYGDGYPRRLSNVGEVLIGGERRKIVGVVCMDQMMVSIGPDGTAYNGDEVVLFGTQGGERITVEDAAALSGCNPREILVALNNRVPKRYLRGGKALHTVEPTISAG